MVEKVCENCNESIRTTNFERHKKRCILGKRFHKRKEKQCEICKDWFKCGISNNHFRKECNGKGKINVKISKCKKCNRDISMSNLKRHEIVCGEKHQIQRRVKKSN